VSKERASKKEQDTEPVTFFDRTAGKDEFFKHFWMSLTIIKNGGMHDGSLQMTWGTERLRKVRLTSLLQFTERFPVWTQRQFLASLCEPKSVIDYSMSHLPFLS